MYIIRKKKQLSWTFLSAVCSSTETTVFNLCSKDVQRQDEGLFVMEVHLYLSFVPFVDEETQSSHRAETVESGQMEDAASAGSRADTQGFTCSRLSTLSLEAPDIQ